MQAKQIVLSEISGDGLRETVEIHECSKEGFDLEVSRPIAYPFQVFVMGSCFALEVSTGEIQGQLRKGY
jgi:hypothetical protein